jgi:hypothetical protein
MGRVRRILRPTSYKPPLNANMYKLRIDIQCSLNLLSSELFSCDADTQTVLKLKEFPADSFILPPAEVERIVTVCLFSPLLLTLQNNTK